MHYKLNKFFYWTISNNTLLDVKAWGDDYTISWVALGLITPKNFAKSHSILTILTNKLLKAFIVASNLDLKDSTMLISSPPTILGRDEGINIGPKEDNL